MIPAAAYANASLDDIRAALAGGSLTIYSVARPDNADWPVERSSALATFTFADPAFGAPEGETEMPIFTEESVLASDVGTPGFARACNAEGAVVADFSAGPGPREIKFAEVSCSKDAPVKITRFAIQASDSWPERPDYYNTHPRDGFPQPATR